MKILLVEDEEKLGRLLARGFGEDGHVVDLVADGAVALEQGRVVA
jgi:two-component system OmpR family response regulator